MAKPNEDLEQELLRVARSVQKAYYPEFSDSKIEYDLQHGPAGETGVSCRMVVLTGGCRLECLYSDPRLLEYKYRPAWSLIFAHEFSHLVNPVDPEAVMRERLPPLLADLWERLLDAGLGVCSHASK